MYNFSLGRPLQFGKYLSMFCFHHEADLSFTLLLHDQILICVFLAAELVRRLASSYQIDVHLFVLKGHPIKAQSQDEIRSLGNGNISSTYSALKGQTVPGAALFGLVGAVRLQLQPDFEGQ